MQRDRVFVCREKERQRESVYVELECVFIESVQREGVRRKRTSNHQGVAQDEGQGTGYGLSRILSSGIWSGFSLSGILSGIIIHYTIYIFFLYPKVVFLFLSHPPSLFHDLYPVFFGRLYFISILSISQLSIFSSLRYVNYSCFCSVILF